MTGAGTKASAEERVQPVSLCSACVDTHMSQMTFSQHPPSGLMGRDAAGMRAGINME